MLLVQKLQIGHLLTKAVGFMHQTILLMDSAVGYFVNQKNFGVLQTDLIPDSKQDSIGLDCQRALLQWTPLELQSLLMLKATIQTELLCSIGDWLVHQNR